MKEAVQRRVAKTKSEAREAKRTSTTVVKASAPLKTVPHATATTRIFRTQHILVIFCRSQCAIDLESSGAPRQGCVHFAGSTSFDSRGQRLLAVYCIFGKCLADPRRHLNLHFLIVFF